mgnify:CR=1 FL=1
MNESFQKTAPVAPVLFFRLVFYLCNVLFHYDE